MPAVAQAPRETSAGIAQAHPKGDQPATVARWAKLCRSSLTSVLTIVLIRFPATAIATPTRAIATNARSRNLREARNEAKAAVAARDSKKQVATPSGTAISAASVRGTVRAHVISRPTPTRTVATPGALISPASNRPGSSSEARTGNSANFPGSIVSSTPKTSIDISSQPTVRPAYAITVTSAVNASEV